MYGQSVKSDRHTQGMPSQRRYRRFDRRESGQAMAEFVVFAPVLVLIFIAIMFFGKGYYMKQKCYVAARYCAWAEGRDQEASAYKQRVNDLIFSGEDSSKVTFNGPMGFSTDDDFGLGTITSILSGLSQAEKYQVKFSMDVPNVMQFIGSSRIPGNIHTVVADCWAWLDPDELFDSATADSGLDEAGDIINQ